MRAPNDKKRPNPHSPSLQQLLRSRGRFVSMPRRTDQDSGRNGRKRAARAGLPRKQWPSVPAM